MKKAVLALAAAAAMSVCVAVTPAWSADTACKAPGPNLFGVADAAALHRATTLTPFTKTVSFTKTFDKFIFIHGHFKWVFYGGHWHEIFIHGHFKVVKVTKTFHKHVKGERTGHHLRWDWGQYVGTSIAAAAVGEITQAVMTPCRQLTLSEAYQNAADAFLPFVGSWMVEQLMPDNKRTYEIARLAKEGKLTQEQALQAYTAAYHMGSH